MKRLYFLLMFSMTVVAMRRPRDPEFDQWLIKAVRQQNKLAAEIALQAGADHGLLRQELLNQGLIDAVNAKNVLAVRMALLGGAHINCCDEFGDPLLFLTINVGTEVSPITKLLVEEGADINIRNKQGLTPLMDAIRRGNEPLATYFIENNADVHAMSERGRTKVLNFISLSDMSIDFIDDLINRCKVDIDDPDIDGRTPLHYAIRDYRVAVARILRRAGAKADIQDNKGKTVIDYVRELNHPDLNALFEM